MGLAAWFSMQRLGSSLVAQSGPLWQPMKGKRGRLGPNPDPLPGLQLIYTILKLKLQESERFRES